MDYYIVEHETRGVFIEKWWDIDKPKYRFSWSKLRTDPAVAQFYNLSKALKLAGEIPKAYVMHVKTKPELTIRRVEPEKVND